MAGQCLASPHPSASPEGATALPSSLENMSIGCIHLPAPRRPHSLQELCRQQRFPKDLQSLGCWDRPQNGGQAGCAKAGHPRGREKSRYRGDFLPGSSKALALLPCDCSLSPLPPSWVFLVLSLVPSFLLAKRLHALQASQTHAPLSGRRESCSSPSLGFTLHLFKSPDCPEPIAVAGAMQLVYAKV